MTAKHYLMSKGAKESLHYASTPTLYYDATKYYPTLEEEGKMYKSTMYLHSSDSSTNSSEMTDDLMLSPQDLKASETCLKGHKTKVFVCKCLANLYGCPKINLAHLNSNKISWTLKFTGIPVLVFDLGNTRSRHKRQIQICLVEKGTGFVLWKDIVDNLTKYQISQDCLFHTMHLSNDHSRLVGLSFDSMSAAEEFHDWLNMLTSDPANISLSGPYRLSPVQAAIMEEAKKKQRRKGIRGPDKKDISSPCGFEHIVSIGSRDYSKFFSLQTFVAKSDINGSKQLPSFANAQQQQQQKIPSRKAKWAPQPPKKRIA